MNWKVTECARAARAHSYSRGVFPKGMRSHQIRHEAQGRYVMRHMTDKTWHMTDKTCHMRHMTDSHMSHLTKHMFRGQTPLLRAMLTVRMSVMVSE